ncbi:MAG: ferredoxin [Bacilli bacterium]|nr:ferredoxin [Bacilli bacterium]
MEKKKISIDKSACIGCGCCAGTYPEDIAIGADGLAESVTGVAEEDVASVCPVGAISVEE